MKILAIILILASCVTASDTDLLAMTYAGPTHDEQQAAIEALQSDVKDLQESVKSIEDRLAAMKPCDKCDNCKCVDCKCNEELDVPVIEFTAPRPLQGPLSSVTLHGRQIDVSSYISQNRGYSAPHWSIANHGNLSNVHQHLRYHGFDGIEGLDKKTLMALHQAAHHANEPVNSTRTMSSAPRASQSVSGRSGCANGNCSRPRRGLFGRYR